ncbi:hypothetical protein PPERSA_01594 [Pseudocohnilembus persalinus]|uniref:Transmembrane protein n=1 Tax=Pseudocohnilembus persalinus TaxID=266149 RepID=A0A0V0QHR2_PSEPJ|nr:hypothetical protein PPERSA_01594 [Pseudocohnilembus persalinus]|eukprot:KRX01724.1 hypothetical protein PPERSA_01594 [Pseudocohnilembus persalinus]
MSKFIKFLISLLFIIQIDCQIKDFQSTLQNCIVQAQSQQSENYFLSQLNTFNKSLQRRQNIEYTNEINKKIQEIQVSLKKNSDQQSEIDQQVWDCVLIENDIQYDKNNFQNKKEQNLFINNNKNSTNTDGKPSIQVQYIGNLGDYCKNFQKSDLDKLYQKMQQKLNKNLNSVADLYALVQELQSSVENQDEKLYLNCLNQVVKNPPRVDINGVNKKFADLKGYCKNSYTWGCIDSWEYLSTQTRKLTNNQMYQLISNQKNMKNQSQTYNEFWGCMENQFKNNYEPKFYYQNYTDVEVLNKCQDCYQWKDYNYDESQPSVQNNKTSNSEIQNYIEENKLNSDYWQCVEKTTSLPQKIRKWLMIAALLLLLLGLLIYAIYKIKKTKIVKGFPIIISQANKQNEMLHCRNTPYMSQLGDSQSQIYYENAKRYNNSNNNLQAQQNMPLDNSYIQGGHLVTYVQPTQIVVNRYF